MEMYHIASIYFKSDKSVYMYSGEWFRQTDKKSMSVKFDVLVFFNDKT